MAQLPVRMRTLISAHPSIASLILVSGALLEVIFTAAEFHDEVSSTSGTAQELPQTTSCQARFIYYCSYDVFRLRGGVSCKVLQTRCKGPRGSHA